MRNELIIGLTVMLFSIYSLHASDSSSDEQKINIDSHILIGSGARVIIDKEASAKVWYDNVIVSNGGILQEIMKELNESNPSDEQEIGLPEEVVGIPKDLTINKAYPNPFNPSVSINYGLPANSDVIFIIHDLSGRKIAKYGQSNKSAGWHEFRWNALDQQGNGVGTGIYLLTIHAGDMVKKQKLTFVK